MRSELIERWDDEGWRFLRYAGVSDEHPVSVVFAVDVTAITAARSLHVAPQHFVVPASVVKRIATEESEALIDRCAAVLGGALFVIVADTVARTIIAPRELPVGAITALIGAPLFIYLLKRV